MVTRETPLSEEIARSFGQAGIHASDEALARVAAYAQVLLDEALPLGFIGPQEADRLVPRHITESAALSLFLAPGERVIDVGSGAGLPGLVVACLRWEMVLVESLEKRATF